MEKKVLVWDSLKALSKYLNAEENKIFEIFDIKPKVLKSRPRKPREEEKEIDEENTVEEENK